MIVFCVKYTSMGVNIFNYSLGYDHIFLFYIKREIEKLVREQCGLKYKRNVVFKW